jgi:hypothetical protein
MSRINPLGPGTSRVADLVELHKANEAVLNQFEKAAQKRTSTQRAHIDAAAANPAPKQALINPRLGSRHWLFLRKLMRRGGLRSNATPFDNHPGTPEADGNQESRAIESIPQEADAPLAAEKTRARRTTDAAIEAAPATSQQGMRTAAAPARETSSALGTLAQHQRARVFAWLERTLANLPYLR